MTSTPTDLDPDHAIIRAAVAGVGPYDDAIRNIVGAVLRSHAESHRGTLLADCIDHDIHEDVARALFACGVTGE